MYKLVFKAWQYNVLYTIKKLQVVCMFMYMCECKYILFIKYCKKARERKREHECKIYEGHCMKISC